MHHTYGRLVQEGRLQSDPSQFAAVQTLHLLQQVLAAHAATPAAAAPGSSSTSSSSTSANYPTNDPSGTYTTSSDQSSSSPNTGSSGSQTAAAAAAAAATAAPAAGPSGPHAVQGTYLWGPVGSGKTMLMDMFARTLPAHVTVRRHHLHDLLTHVHERCHELQQALPKIVVKSRLGLPVYR